MRVPRHLKHPIALWLIDGRQALSPPLKPRDLAQRLGIDEATVRRWETARAGETRNLPSPANVEALERVLGRPSPERIAPTIEASIVSRLDHQTRLLEELLGDRDDRAEYGTTDAAAIRRRRRFWLELAWARLKVTNQRDRLRILEWPSTRRDELSRIESGAQEMRDDQMRDFARAYRIPERILREPPPTDQERLDRWAELALTELPAEPAAQQAEQRRRAS